MRSERISNETDEFADVLLLPYIAEMEAERGMTIAQWVDRYMAAALNVIPRCGHIGVVDKLRKYAKSDFLYVEGPPFEVSPEYSGAFRAGMLMDTHLFFLVFRELDIAADDHGYPITEWSVFGIAEYLMNHSPSIDIENPVALVPAVKEWLRERGKE